MMKIFNRLQNKVNPVKATLSDFKAILAEKFLDYYLVIMGGIFALLGLSPVTLMFLQY